MTSDHSQPDLSSLANEVGDRLLHVERPLQACLDGESGPACAEALDRLRNPFAVEDDPGAFHTTGWYRAFEAGHSPFAVAAESARDVAAAVNFARETGTRLAVKGTGHDYVGRSGSAGSLLIWTHRMRSITVHDSFVPTGATGTTGVPAVTVGAGTRWLEVYQALAARDRFVQGGGCTTVGAAGGFTQGGGFGPFSRRFGTAAGNVLEVEVVTAAGETVMANEVSHPDLFWALRGGGGGTFGVVTEMTLRTHPMPDSVGFVVGTITAPDDESFRRLLRELVRLLPALCDEHWGEQIIILPDNSIQVAMTTVDLADAEASAVLRPLHDWITSRGGELTSDVEVFSIPMRTLWDHTFMDALAPDYLRHDDRPGASPANFWWDANQGEVSQYIHSYTSRWLPKELLDRSPDHLAAALFDASRHRHVDLHLNKALWGAATDAVARDRATAINPAAFDAFALVIIASIEQLALPGVPSHEPDRELAELSTRQVGDAMAIIRALAPGAGSYVNEADYFEPDWQTSFWGANYPRLLEIKQRYDPTNLFQVHHGVGSTTAEEM